MAVIGDHKYNFERVRRVTVMDVIKDEIKNLYDQFKTAGCNALVMTDYKHGSYYGYTGSVEQIAVVHNNSHSITIDLEQPLVEQNFARGINHPSMYKGNPYIAPRFRNAIANFDQTTLNGLTLKELANKMPHIMLESHLPDDKTGDVPPSSQEQTPSPVPSA